LAVVAIVALFSEEPNYAYSGEAEVLQGWIGALISGVANVAGGIASGIVANKQAAKAQAEQAKSEQMLKDWYDTTVNTNILDRADTMSMLNAYRETMAEQNKKYLNNAIKGGASEEAKVAYAQAQNKGYADAISKITAQGQQRKEQVVDAYMQGMRNIHDAKANQYLQSGQRMANVISQATNGISSAIGGMDWGGGLKPNKAFKGVKVDPTASWDWGEEYA
jgi:hypothetical protein